uniref:Uncharacterized protein n=1 Tax=Romanomermis culicivorax TaxID=13658 RepID=A0A915L697_ROMCU
MYAYIKRSKSEYPDSFVTLVLKAKFKFPIIAEVDMLKAAPQLVANGLSSTHDRPKQVKAKLRTAGSSF